jgi:hypothetical protein
MTTGDSTFGANQAAEIEQAQQMATSLDNLTNAPIQKNATINNLVATNAALSRDIQDKKKHTRHDDDHPTSCTGHASPCTPRPAYRRTPPRPPSPLGDQQTSLGQDRVLLVPRLQGENRAQQQHLHLPSGGPPAGHHSEQHNGRCHIQHGLAYCGPSHPSRLTWRTSGI